MQDLEFFQKYKPVVENWESFCKIHTHLLPTTIWTNPLRTTPEKMAHILAADGVPFELLPYYPGGFKLAASFKPGYHWAYLAGLYQVQEASAMLPVLLLDPQPGERILDLCAAPGNKTAQIAVKLKNSGTVVANDINFGRMRAVRQSLERLGIVNVTTMVHDGANLPNSTGPFDRVLVDVPCSCQGTLRRDKKVVSPADLELTSRKVGLQKALLRRAIDLCKPGGRIVYATCTYPPEENEMVVDAVLQDYGDIAHVLPARITDFESSPGLAGWEGQQFAPSLAQTMRVWPHQNDTGGFFIAVLEKLDDGVVRSGEGAGFAADTVDAKDEFLQIVAGRFGIPAEQLQAYRFFEPGGGKLYLTNHNHLPPVSPRPDASGMLFMRTRVRYPKITTAAALLLGQAATQNYVDVDNRQVHAYVSRQDFNISVAQGQFCTGVGYILIRYQGYVLGVGMYYPREDGGVVESLFPKGWSPVKN